MGTTLTAAIVDGDEVAFAHVGDSRAYLWRDGELRLLTSDHSLVEELRRQGRLTDEQAEDHPQRSIITRALGPEETVEVDTMTFSARPGDVFLLCSDGLTTMMKEDAIARVLSDTRVARRCGVEAGRRGEPGRRPRQHHRRRLPARGRRGAAATRARNAGRAERRGGGSDRRAGRAAARTAGGGRATPPPTRRNLAARRPRSSRRSSSSRRSRSAPGTAFARSTSSASTTGAGSPLYRGLPYDLPLGISLYSESASIPVEVDLDPRRSPRFGRQPRAALARRRGHPARRSRERGHRSGPAGRAAPAPVAAVAAAHRRRVAGRPSDPRRAEGQEGAAQAARGAAADLAISPAATRAPRLMSARNRELLALVPVAVLVTVGFAAVFIVHERQRRSGT